MTTDNDATQGHPIIATRHPRGNAIGDDRRFDADGYVPERSSERSVHLDDSIAEHRFFGDPCYLQTGFFLKAKANASNIITDLMALLHQQMRDYCIGAAFRFPIFWGFGVVGLLS